MRVTDVNLASTQHYDGPANDAVLSLLQEEDRRVLDLGCGAGANARRLRERGVVVHGVTSSDLEARAAEAWCERVFVHDLERGLPAGIDPSYDVVLASHVLEHLRQPDALLVDVGRILEGSDGRLIVAIPNLLHYKNRVALLFGRIEYQDAGLMDTTHYKWYTFASCRGLLESAGFRVERASADGGAPWGPIRRWAPATLRRRVDDACCRIVPGLFGYQLIFVARKASKDSRAVARDQVSQ